MPHEYRNHKMTVLCNDCLHKSKVKFHVVGGKCEKCKSYNTTQVGGLIEEKEEENQEQVVAAENGDQINQNDDNSQDWSDLGDEAEVGEDEQVEIEEEKDQNEEYKE